MGVTPGYQDVLYLDNVKVAKDLSGIHSVYDEKGNGDELTFDLKGYRLPGNAVNSGSIVIRDGKKVMVRNK